jgi:MFS family permease
MQLAIPVVPFAVESRAGVPKSDVQSAISWMLAAYAVGPLVASPFIGWMAGPSLSNPNFDDR